MEDGAAAAVVATVAAVVAVNAATNAMASVILLEIALKATAEVATTEEITMLGTAEEVEEGAANATVAMAMATRLPIVSKARDNVHHSDATTVRR